MARGLLMDEPISVEEEAMNVAGEGGTYFEIDAPPPGPAKIDYDRTVNLVPIFKQLGEEGTDFLKMLGEMVVRHKDIDWNSSADYRQRCARQVELFAGILPPRPEGHENIAQIHLPIIGQAVLLLHATLHGQLFPPGGQLCAGAPTTPASTERAKRLGLHLNWQISQQVPEYIPAHDRGGMKMLISGNTFSKWYYNPAKKRPCFVMVQSDDLILPYGAQSVDPNLADVPRITERMRLYRHQLEAMQDAGYYDGIDEIYNPLPGEEGASSVTKSAGNGAAQDPKRGPMQDTMDKVQGQTPPTDTDDDQPRILLEQHRWLKLLGEDRERPVIATVDEATKKVVYLSIREDEDSRDRARYNRELAANEASHAAAMAQHQVAMQQYMATVQQMTTPQLVPGPDGMPVEVPPQMPPGMTPDQMPVPPEEPVPPPEPEPVEMVTVNWYTKYGCIPNPEGIYDYGVGYLLEGANITADTMMSQIVAAMTLSLFPTYLYSRQARMGRGDLALKMGGGVEVALPPEQMQNAFFQLQFPPPNPNAIKIVEAQQAQVQEFVGASEILAGEVGGSNETATTTEIRMGAARQNLAVIGVRYNRSRTAELKNLARINSRTMPAAEWFAVTQPAMPGAPPGADQVKMEQVARDEYLEDFNITFTCDPNLASRPQMVADAQKALQAAMSIPPGILDPVAQMTAIRVAYVGLLKAMGREDMAQIIEASPLPQPPMMPPGPGGPGGPPPPNGPPGRTPNGKPGTQVPGAQRGPAPPVASGPGNAGPPTPPKRGAQ